VAGSVGTVEMQTHVVTGPGGRKFWVEDAGASSGFPVLVHSGSPGSRRLFVPAADHAAGHGLRLISYDRPGYGDTPAKPGRSIADAADETRVIAALLGISRLAVWGYSGGGPYALACAALLPGLVVAGCVFASPAPFGAAGLDFCAGSPAAHRREVELFFSEPELAREQFRVGAGEVFAGLSTAAGWLDRWGDAAQTDPAHSVQMAHHLALVQRDSLGHSDQGWWDDWVANLCPWGFDPAEIGVPIQLWHGERDPAVSAAHGRWLAARIPGVEAHFPGTDDHASIEAAHQGQAYAWLSRRAAEDARRTVTGADAAGRSAEPGH